MRRLAVVAASLLALAACGGDEPRQLAGYVRDPAPQVDEVALPDVSRGGEPTELRADDGRLLVVYFGYTNCPDICPTTLADLRAALARMDPEQAGLVDLAMVTVDPARDTDTLAAYVQSFVDGAHALATDDDALLQQAAGPFGVTYAVTTGAGGEVEVAHSTQLYAVDDQGRLAITWPFGTTAEDLAGDLEQLLEAGAEASGA
jgi:protein SCO1/2